MIKNAFLAYCLLYTQFAFSQTKGKGLNKPKLVIGLVIDQMRWDYLYRYYDLYSNTGFKRLLNEGFSCENTLIPYVPTYTAPGHSSIYTGSVPAINGIIGNDWYEKTLNKKVYCTADSTVAGVGSSSIASRMSPINLWTTTITDELKLSNNFKSKVVGIALKDRGSIFPVGHTANAAYWFDTSIAKWISSSYYMKNLPEWVNNFNDKKLPDLYLSRDWNTIMPLDKYTLSTSDNKGYERSLAGESSVTFPHQLSKISKDKYLAFEYTPFGNSLTFEFAKATLDNEKLGTNNVTDFIAISLSSTDLVGHWFGPNSIEIEDTYLRLDKELGEFLKHLDTKYGKDDYLLFLTADHGVAHVPGFMQENNLPAGVFSDGEITKEINELIEKKFNVKNTVQLVLNYQVYLNTIKIEKEGKVADEIIQAVIKFLKQKPYIVDAFENEKIANTTIPEQIKTRIINGYNPKRSGEIEFITRPQYFDYGAKGTTHGSWNPYDTHIPLLWFGWNIKKGTTNREIYMTDIAPTLAAMLKIQMPSGSVGKVIEEVIR